MKSIDDSGAEVIDLQARLPQILATRAERTSARAAERAALEASRIAKRAKDAQVPKAQQVLDYVLAPEALDTECVLVVRRIVSKYTSSTMRPGGALGLIVFISADVGRGKSVAACREAVRTELTFRYVEASRVHKLEFSERAALEAAEILVIDEVSRTDVNVPALIELLLHRFNNGRLTLILGNILLDTILEKFLIPDPPLQSRLDEQENVYGVKWFEPIEGPDLRFKG